MWVAQIMRFLLKEPAVGKTMKMGSYLSNEKFPELMNVYTEEMCILKKKQCHFRSSSPPFHGYIISENKKKISKGELHIGENS